MPSYTPEQIDDVRKRLASYRRGMKNREIANNIYVLLSALSTAEQERDALAAYAAKLEKAGDDMRESSDGSILHCDAIRDWDVARKERP